MNRIRERNCDVELIKPTSPLDNVQQKTINGINLSQQRGNVLSEDAYGADVLVIGLEKSSSLSLGDATATLKEGLPIQ